MSKVIAIANQKLKESDSQYRYLTSLRFMELTAETYGIDRAADIADRGNPFADDLNNQICYGLSHEEQ